MTNRPSIYRVTRTCRYGGGAIRSAGDLWVDPPTAAVDSLDRHLGRLDEDGRLPRDELGTMQYQTLQQLAAAGDIDDVNGNSEAEAIVDAYALGETNDVED